VVSVNEELNEFTLINLKLNCHICLVAMVLEITVLKYKYFRIVQYDQIIFPLMPIQYVIHVSEELQTWIRTDFLL